MKKNVGGIDRVLRIVLGLLIGAAGLYYENWLGLIGLIPLATGIFSTCGLYSIFGWSTCKKAEAE